MIKKLNTAQVSFSPHVCVCERERERGGGMCVREDKTRQSTRQPEECRVMLFLAYSVDATDTAVSVLG